MSAVAASVLICFGVGCLISPESTFDASVETGDVVFSFFAISDVPQDLTPYRRAANVVMWFLDPPTMFGGVVREEAFERLISRVPGCFVVSPMAAWFPPWVCEQWWTTRGIEPRRRGFQGPSRLANVARKEHEWLTLGSGVSRSAFRIVASSSPYVKA